MDESGTIRVLDVGSKSLVVTLSGVLDASWADRLATEVERRGSRRVIVDLLDTIYVDDEVQSFLVSAAEHAPLTVVAETWLLHVFELTRRTRSLQLTASLAEAV
jgi:anti-anti-sigma regulatory factor